MFNIHLWATTQRDGPPALLAILACAAAALTAVVLYRRNPGHRLGGRMSLRDAIDAMPEGLAFFDAADRLVAWNTRYADLCKTSGPLSVGLSFADLLRARVGSGDYVLEPGTEDAWIAQRVATRRAARDAFEQPMANGRWLKISDRHTADGGIVSVCVDITELKSAEAAMAQARDEAIAATRVKSEFLANMSHEIRTPMNGIMVMNALMLRTNLSPDQRKFAQTVQTSAEALLTILNDILDVSKLEAGKVELEAVDFSLHGLVRDVIDLLAPRAGDKRIALSQDLDPGALLPMRGDPGRIRQVLLNLMSNAVKFTDSGEVAVKARTRACEGGRTLLRIEVSDTGIGLTDEAKSRLFQSFQQADGSITRRFGGTGLGLSICRQLVQLMGGEIGVEDGPEGGSVFWFELRMAQASDIGAVEAAAKTTAA